MSDSIKLGSVALDGPDAGALAAFYAEITGGKVTFLDQDWATVQGPGGRIDFQTAPGYVPPRWPDPASSMQAHLDFDVEDADAAEARVLAAGATKFDFQPGDHFRVYADPAGHPFCLCTEDVPGPGLIVVMAPAGIPHARRDGSAGAAAARRYSFLHSPPCSSAYFRCLLERVGVAVVHVLSGVVRLVRQPVGLQLDH